MTIPAYIVRKHVLGLFAGAARAGVDATGLLVIQAVSMAGNREEVTLDHIKLFTGLQREDALNKTRVLKTAGFLEQIGAGYLTTSRSRELLDELEGGGA